MQSEKVAKSYQPLLDSQIFIDAMSLHITVKTDKKNHEKQTTNDPIIPIYNSITLSLKQICIGMNKQFDI